MNTTIKGMAIAAIILSTTALFRGGFELFLDGILVGAGMLIRIIPLLVVAFAVAGLIAVLINEEKVSRWLGKEAGWKGPFFGALAGALVPGGPFFFYPMMATLLLSGAEIGTLISFVAAKTIWSVGRIPMEIAFVGTELTILRLAVTFIFPILVGMIINTFFSGMTEKIKSDVENTQLKNTNKEASKADYK
ncbi:permease [Natranaerofaba carboxydovora]|uniref:permease n=1 Tax=Natranaerofaba carboxydovora TaxID=2742683 RepID=UPI001F13DFDD|nr:permease [Natranaerofaba carboxydovora]UMZ74659.1 putative permease [Natranaerofaba carboxydovora]